VWAGVGLAHRQSHPPKDVNATLCEAAEHKL